MLFRVVGMDISRPPHFDDTNFPYYKARMACYLEAIDLGLWRVTRVKGPNMARGGVNSLFKNLQIN